MSFLSGKNVLLGISGGIAAYKTPLIVRLLKKRKCNVRVIMTPSAKDFVSPLTLSTLSENDVLSTFTSESKDNKRWNGEMIYVDGNENSKYVNGEVVKEYNEPLTLINAQSRGHFS